MSEWIKCSERMPDIYGKVVIIQSGFYCDPFVVRYNGNDMFDELGNVYPIEIVSHWMPLPEPPKVEK